MKLAASALAIVVAGCSIVSAQAAAALTDRDADRTAIMRSIAEVSKAYAARDPEPFERIYLDTYVSVRGKPVYNHREQLIAMMRADSLYLRAGKRLDFETISYESDYPEIRLYGSIAIVNSGKKHHWQYKGQKCVSRSQATEIWVKTAGEWKIAAGHTSTFHCEPRPYYPVHAAVNAIPSRGRPPLNADKTTEQEVRDIINGFVIARTNGEGELQKLIQQHRTEDFLFTNIDGEVNRDYSLIAAMPPSSTARTIGLRNHDDALLVFENAALYTFKIRTTGPTEVPQQGSVFFAKTGGRWVIAAAHLSRFSRE